ncbi:hypothetical protein QUB60_03075 [Microcoleus sp. A2-C5]
MTWHRSQKSDGKAICDRCDWRGVHGRSALGRPCAQASEYREVNQSQ